jgi:hypothetical protein
MLGGGTARFLATPMQMKFIFDLACFRVSPMPAGRNHEGRRAKHELQVPACDRRCLISLDRQDQTIPEVAFAGTAADERRHWRREDRGSPGIRSLRRLVRRMFDDGIKACAVERYSHRTQHLVRALGEGAQHRIRTIIGIPERRVDEARELFSIRLQTGFRRHGAAIAFRGRALAPFMEQNGRVIPLRSGFVFTRRPGWSLLLLITYRAGLGGVGLWLA